MNSRDIRFATPKIPRGQQVLFPQCLDEVIGQDAPVRAFAALLERVDWSAWEQSYTGIGQPPIHPYYLAGTLLWGLLHKIQSSRILERAARKDLDFIWLLEGFTPDHTTLAKFRTGNAEAIKGLQDHFARTLVERRDNALLRLIVDGTRLRADSGRQGARTAQTIEFIIGELERRMQAMSRGDACDEVAAETAWIEGLEEPVPENPVPANPDIARLERKLAKYQKALEVARQRDVQARAHNGEKARPTRVPVTDPDSQVLPNKEGGYGPNYTPVATTEAQTGAIIHSDVLSGSQEADAVLPAVTAAEQLTGEKVDAVLADGNFAAGPVLDELEKNGTAAYMPTRSASPPDNPALRPDPAAPVPEELRAKLPRTGDCFARSAFVYDAGEDAYFCPMGERLDPYKRGKSKDGSQCTYYRTAACTGCPLAAQCIKGKGARSITRDQYENLREAADQRMATPEGKAVYKQRSPGIEGVFAIIKAILGIRRFSVRGLAKVRTEWSWICSAYNLKKLLAWEASAASNGTGNGIRPQNPRVNQDLRHMQLLYNVMYIVVRTQSVDRCQQSTRRPQYVPYAYAA